MHDQIQRILAGEETITPSAEFLSAVMAAVEREAAAPPPLDFPWSRALPGLLATVAALAVAIWHGLGSLMDPVSVSILTEEVRELASAATAMGLHWLLLAAAMTILAVTLPLCLTRGRIRADERLHSNLGAATSR